MLLTGSGGRSAGATSGAEAIGLAIEYWQDALRKLGAQRHAFRCVACGFVTLGRAAPLSCQSCGGTVWDFIDESEVRTKAS